MCFLDTAVWWWSWTKYVAECDRFIGYLCRGRECLHWFRLSKHLWSWHTFEVSGFRNLSIVSINITCVHHLQYNMSFWPATKNKEAVPSFPDLGIYGWGRDHWRKWTGPEERSMDIKIQYKVNNPRLLLQHYIIISVTISYSQVWNFLNQSLTLLLSIGRVLKSLSPGEEEPMKSHLRSSNRQRVRCLSYIVSDVRLRALSVAHTIKSISKEKELLPGIYILYKWIH